MQKLTSPEPIKLTTNSSNLCLLLMVLVCLGFGFAAQASILTLSYGSTDNSALNCSYYNWTQTGISVFGQQYSAGQMAGVITTDTTTDPTLTLTSSLNNDTLFPWTGYQVSVSMTQTFTLSGAQVTVPSGWTANVTQPELSGGFYVGHVNYSAGTPVAVGGTLNYAFTMSFSGATQYSFTEAVVPVPEPGAVGFAFLTGAGLACVVVARGRQMRPAKCRGAQPT